MNDDKRYMGFWIGHLHEGERNRIHSDGPNPHEREMLAKNEDPWAKFRGPLPPHIPAYIKPESPKSDEKRYLVFGTGADGRPEVRLHPEPPSPEELALQKREELLKRDEELQRKREEHSERERRPKPFQVYKRRASLWPGADEEHARKMQAAFEGKKADTPTSKLPTPWHKHRELVVGILLASGAAIMGLVLWLVAPNSTVKIVLGLVAILGLLSFSFCLMLHYFGWKRPYMVISVILVVLMTGGFGWYVWPTPQTSQSPPIENMRGPHALIGWGADEQTCNGTVDGKQLAQYADQYDVVILTGIDRVGVDPFTDQGITVSAKYALYPDDISIVTRISDPMRAVITSAFSSAPKPTTETQVEITFSIWYQLVLLPKMAETSRVKSLADLAVIRGKILNNEKRHMLITVRAPNR